MQTKARRLFGNPNADTDPPRSPGPKRPRCGSKGVREGVVWRGGWREELARLVSARQFDSRGLCVSVSVSVKRGCVSEGRRRPHNDQNEEGSARGLGVSDVADK